MGSCIFCTGSLIGQIETAHKVPTRDFAERVDAALMTDGAFSRLVGLVLRSQLPTWFQQYAEMEARAEYISTYQCQLVYGLLQTEAYARAVLGVEQADKLDEMVAARMERQRILKRDSPPVVWTVLDEAVLYREIGGKAVMRDQLTHLLGLFGQPWMELQVLPFSAGEHAGMMGSFTLLRFDDDPALHYNESYDSGHMTANPQVIRERSVGYARLQAEALSPRESAALIARVMEERYGERAQWRKSSYSGSSGGECIECAPLGTADWRKSTFCASGGSDCLEVADLTPHIALRDSKNPEAGVFTVSPDAFSAFVAYASS